jgi:D-lactate dehydrogenase (cytochrome)
MPASGRVRAVPDSPVLATRLVAALDGDASRVTAGSSERELHSADLSFHRPHCPDVVVYPRSTHEVSAVLALASEQRIAVTPFGAGSSLEGNAIPVAGGISLDLTRMDRIVAISSENLTAVVQPGVTRTQLERAGGEHGLFFPVDPGADATLGGMAATNAAGTTTVRYGKMRANVLALEAVLAGGEVIRTGSGAPKTSAGYDLTGLLVGSEGTLAVITELTLRLHGIPEHLVAVRLAFSSLEAACRVASAAVAAGAGLMRLELVDAHTMRAVNAYENTVYPEAPSLFVEAGGPQETVQADLELVLELAAAEGAVDVVHVTDSDSRAALWRARHAAAYAASAAAPGRKHRSTDVCVPVSQLAAAVTFAREQIERSGLAAGLIAHAGDGNVHVGLMLDPDDESELAIADALAEALVIDALARGGTCTGEHGVGIGKIGALEREHGDLLPLLRGVKDLFDPLGILNPGKILRPSEPALTSRSGGTGPAPTMR